MGLGGIIGVKRGKNQVPRFRCGYGRADRFYVTHFPRPSPHRRLPEKQLGVPYGNW